MHILNFVMIAHNLIGVCQKWLFHLYLHDCLVNQLRVDCAVFVWFSSLEKLCFDVGLFIASHENMFFAVRFAIGTKLKKLL